MEPTKEYIREYISRRKGVDLGRYQASTYSRLLLQRIKALGLDSLGGYWAFLTENPDEADRLIEAASVSVSSFFRDSLVWEIISGTILPEMFERRRREGRKYFLAWSAGCAKGQEAYSIAILVHKILADDLGKWRIHILGTDMSPGPWSKAVSQTFSRPELEEVKFGIVGDYFVARPEGFEISPRVRNMVKFSVEDLTSGNRFAPAESVFGGFDLVLCRNVLIYYSSEAQAIIVDKLIRSLAPGGGLILGRDESLPEETASRLSVFDSANRIYLKQA
ncbi:MAG: protein-glutamate O-methyltransferase CheR [Pseudomonadota bacterium]